MYIYFLEITGILNFNKNRPNGYKGLREIKINFDKGMSQMENDFDIKNFITELRQTQINIKIEKARKKKEFEKQELKKKLKKKMKKRMQAMMAAPGLGAFNFPKAENILANKDSLKDREDNSNLKPTVTQELIPSPIQKALFATPQIIIPQSPVQ